MLRSINGPFFNERGILLSSSILHDHVACPLVATRLVTACRLAPRRYRIAAARGLTFAAAMRVIDRIHRDASNLRPLAHPATATRFTERNILVLGVAALSYGRHTDDGNAPDFARRHTHLRVVAFLRDDLGKAACRTDHLTALSGTKLDVMNFRTERNVFDRQRIARQ